MNRLEQKVQQKYKKAPRPKERLTARKIASRVQVAFNPFSAFLRKKYRDLAAKRIKRIKRAGRVLKKALKRRRQKRRRR